MKKVGSITYSRTWENKLRWLFVNHCHPAIKHVCGTRLREFAKVAVEKGHQVLLLTQALREDNISSDKLREDLRKHDWQRFYHLPVKPLPEYWLDKARNGGLFSPLRQVLIALSYLKENGVFQGWRKASEIYWPIIADEFKPDTVFASFGNTDVLNIGQGIADIANCPWVLDIKDPWSGFIHPYLRHILASRYHPAAITALSHFHAADTRDYFGIATEVVYSGIDSGMISPGVMDQDGIFRLLLIGGVYEQERLEGLFAGLRTWLASNNRPEKVLFEYAGADYQRVGAISRTINCNVNIYEFLPLDKLRQKIWDADINLYVRSAGSAFHHKIFELIASRKPALCFPNETPETLGIFKATNSMLFNCSSVPEVASSLTATYNNSHIINIKGIEEFLWEKQGDKLIKMLELASKQ